MGPRDLAAVIATDASLAAQFVSCVNTDYFAPRHPIVDMQRAVGHLGLQSACSLLVCLCARRLVSPRAVGEFPFDEFWEGSLRRAVAAQAIALRLGLQDHFDLFPVGLCQDIGVLLRAEHNPNPSPFWDLAAPASERLDSEAQFGDTHDKLGLVLFHRWELPAELAVPIRYHHDPALAPQAHRLRAAIAHAADAVADLMAIDDKPMAMELLEAALGQLSMNADVIEDLIDHVGEQVVSAAAAFSVAVQPQPTYEELAEEACQRRSMVQLKQEELSRQLASTLTERERLQRELESLRTQLTHERLTCAVTGLPNARALEQRLERELGQAAVLRTDFALLLLSPDGLGTHNEHYGVQSGDEVLRRVAEVIRGALYEEDGVFRFSGGKLAAMLRAGDADGVARTAARLRRAVSARVAVGGRAVSLAIGPRWWGRATA